MKKGDKICRHPRHIVAEIWKCVDCETQGVSYKKWDFNDAILSIKFPKDFNKRYEDYKRKLLYE